MNHENLAVAAPGQPGAPQPSQQTVSLVDIVNVVADRAEPVIKLITTVSERSLKSKEANARFSMRMTIAAIFVVSLIVCVAGALTYVGKLDGASFTFLLGLIVGYLLTFLRDSISPPGE